MGIPRMEEFVKQRKNIYIKDSPPSTMEEIVKHGEYIYRREATKSSMIFHGTTKGMYMAA